MEAHKSPKSEAAAEKPRDERSEPARASSKTSDDAKLAEVKTEAKSDPKPEPKAKRAREKAKNNVRKLRMERMMSKAELARRAGLSTLTVDRVERGMPCRMDTKRKILEALGLKPSDRVMVFGDSPDEHEED